MKIRRNSERTGLFAGLAIVAAGILLILLPVLADMDMMQSGFALQFGGFFVVVVGLITAGIFGYRTARLASMFAGKKLLAHWVYDPVQLETQAERDLQTTKSRNRFLFLLVLGFMLACTVLFVVIGYLNGEKDSMPLFVALMAGVLLIVAVFAFGMPYIQYRRARRSGGEVYIASNALYVNGALHTWGAPLAMLDDVSLEEDGGLLRLVFYLQSLSRTSATAYQAYSVEVPIPPGEEQTAQKVVLYFQEQRLAAGPAI